MTYATQGKPEKEMTHVIHESPEDLKARQVAIGAMTLDELAKAWLKARQRWRTKPSQAMHKEAFDLSQQFLTAAKTLQEGLMPIG